jgi:hypothetical protein
MRMLACHPDLAWISNYNERFVKNPRLSFFSRSRNFDLTAGQLKGWKRYLPIPREAIEVPRYVTNGLFQSNHVLESSDIDPTAVSAYRDYITHLMRWQGKNRFLHKHTGFARIHFLDQLDPNGQFVQIVRDGRAVAYSLMRVEWWDGSMRSWWWGEMPSKYREEYEKSEHNPVILAGIVWKHLLDLTHLELHSLPEKRMLTISYTDFVRDPMTKLEQICAHCDLDMNDIFVRRLKNFRIRNADEAWQRGLPSTQIELLNDSLGEHLARFGFEI